MTKKVIVELGLHINQTPNFVKTARENDLNVYLIEGSTKIKNNKALVSLFDKTFVAENDDFEKINAWLKQQINIIGLISFEEDWLITTAKLNKSLNLLGTSLRSVTQTINKVKTHEL